MPKKHYNNGIMNELRELLQDNLNIEFISAVLSNPRDKDRITKVRVRPLLKKEQLVFQIETFCNNQAFHRNAPSGEACEILLGYLENMRQMQLTTTRYLYTVLVSKKGKVTVKKKARQTDCREVDRSHDRKKNYNNFSESQ